MARPFESLRKASNLAAASEIALLIHGAVSGIARMASPAVPPVGYTAVKPGGFAALKSASSDSTTGTAE